MSSSEKSLIDANPEPLRMDLEFYDDIRARVSERKLLQRSIIPPNNGRGFRVDKGQTFKIIQEEGPQVVDVCLWNADCPQRESLSLNRTLLADGLFITTNSRLWSDLPMYRPIATCIEDTVETGPADEGWHAHFSGSHCASEVWELTFGVPGLNGCHLNLLQGAESMGLTEEDVIGDNINLFMKMRIDGLTGRRYFSKTDAKKADHIEFYAEIDLLISVSVCPDGDSSLIPKTFHKLPIAVEIYETGIEPKEFKKWTDWRPNWKGSWEASRS